MMNQYVILRKNDTTASPMSVIGAQGTGTLLMPRIWGDKFDSTGQTLVRPKATNWDAEVCVTAVWDVLISSNVMIFYPGKIPE